MTCLWAARRRLMASLATIRSSQGRNAAPSRNRPNYIQLLNSRVDQVTKADVLEWVRYFLNEAKPHQVITANPLATQAACGVLRDGGTAADALITAQAVLGLVEPQSSGIGGGGFLLYYDAATRSVQAYDGRIALRRPAGGRIAPE